MESCVGCVFAAYILTHDPGVGITHFFDRVSREAHQVRIPAGDTGVVTGHALADLHQRVLDVTGLLIVLKIFGQLLVRKLPPKPGVPPEQKRHEHDQPAGGEKQQPVASGHPRLGRRVDGFCDRLRGFLGRIWKG